MSSGVAYGGSVAALSLEQEQQPCAAASHYAPSSLCSEQSIVDAGASLGARKERGAGARELGVSAENVLRAFNTWAFKREQPSDRQLMLHVIAEAIAAQKAVPFVLYWGKGPRREAGEAESQCLDFIAALSARVAGVYAPGATMTLILTDTHAELNGHRREDINHYFDEIKRLAARRGFDTCWLGHLVKAAGNLATAAPLDDAISAAMMSILTASAQKWYRGTGTPEQGALSYLRMNLIEQRVVERAFPHSIFVTFNGSDLRGLFPRQLPIFYMYSLRRGVAVKPWFLLSEQTKSSAEQANPNHPDASLQSPA